MVEVITLDVETRLDIPPERVLKKALEADMEGVVLIGYTKDGSYYAASSYADGGTVLWLLETCRLKLMKVDSLIDDEVS